MSTAVSWKALSDQLSDKQEYYEKCGRRVGFKVSGGVRTTAKEILGDEWMTNDLFRIGASSLANNLFASITGTKEKPF